MAGDVPFVSVIVPVRDGEREIADCIASLLRCGYPEERREIIVVDNGSTDRTAEIVRRYAVRAAEEPRRGPSHARNRGVALSRGAILAFTDADCVAAVGWMRELARGFDDADTFGVAGAIFSYPPATAAQRYMARRKVCWQKAGVESRWWPFAATGNVAFRRQVFERVGLFDPMFLRAQDKDFGRRFLSAGLRLVYRPSAVVLHRHKRTAAELFRQHAGWAYGSGLLHAKYGLPWSVGDEADKYRELIRSVGRLASAAARSRDRKEISYAYFDVLRCFALRVGTLRWAIRQRLAPARFEDDPPR